MEHITITDETLTALDLMERLKPNIDINGLNNVTINDCIVTECEEVMKKHNCEKVIKYISSNDEEAREFHLSNCATMVVSKYIELFGVLLYDNCHIDDNRFFLKEALY